LKNNFVYHFPALAFMKHHVCLWWSHSVIVDWLRLALILIQHSIFIIILYVILISYYQLNIRSTRRWCSFLLLLNNSLNFLLTLLKILRSFHWLMKLWCIKLVIVKIYCLLLIIMSIDLQNWWCLWVCCWDWLLLISSWSEKWLRLVKLRIITQERSLFVTTAIYHLNLRIVIVLISIPIRGWERCFIYYNIVTNPHKFIS
jgi:hypothetical protein